MNIVAIIQARMGSQRLSGKSLADIAGQPLLGHIIDRIRGSKLINNVVLATTDKPSDEVLVNYCATKNVKSFCGSEEDVLDRFYRAASGVQADVIVRVTADDPFKDPAVIDLVISELLSSDSVDYASNTLKPTFPEGLDIEVIRFSAFEQAWREARLPSEREHVTPYIWKNPQKFCVRNVEHSVDLSKQRWTLDYEKDLEFTRAVYARLYKGQIFSMPSILALLEAEPAIAAINQGFQRNAGYIKSISKEQPIMRITDLERKYVDIVLENQFRNSTSPGMTKRLEEAFAEKFDSKFAITFANGTATMHATLAAAGVGHGDEVIVPPLTMASTAFCVLHAGAVPVFADVHPETWTLDPRSVAERITSRTKAIIPVSLYGLTADMDPLMELAKKHGLFVLEDDAECFLGYYKGRIAGGIAHASSFSFQSSKHISCGEGGMITTNDEELATKIRRMSSLGYGAVSGGAGKSKITRETIQDPNYLRHTSVGWNYRMAEICSAVVLGQVERIEELVKVRLDSAAALRSALNGCKWLVPQAVPEGYVHSYWTLVCRLSDGVSFSWYDFRKKYMELGGDGFYGAWALNYLEPAFRDQRFGEWQTQSYDTGLCPVAEKLQPRLMQLKTNYTDAERLKRAADALHRAIEFFGRG
jgi:perosamine synthetase